jgi:ParB-like chromosome segregation protein Spo0J
MGKQALEGTRLNAFGVEPEKLIIVGLDTDDGPEHPFYDQRVKLPVKEGLVASMVAIGWFGSILVQKQSDGRVFVTDGRQRVRAAREANKRLSDAGKELIQITCIPRRGGDADVIAVAANELRQDDPPLVKAEKAAALLNRGRSEEQICLAFDLSPSGLRALLSLGEAHPSVRKAVDSGQINTTAAYELSKLPLEKQDEALKELIASGVAGRGIGAAAREAVRQRKRKAKNGSDESYPPIPRFVLKTIAENANEWTIDPSAVATIKAILGLGPVAKVSGLTAAVKAIEEKRAKRIEKRIAKAGKS